MNTGILVVISSLLPPHFPDLIPAVSSVLRHGFLHNCRRGGDAIPGRSPAAPTAYLSTRMLLRKYSQYGSELCGLPSRHPPNAGGLCPNIYPRWSLRVRLSRASPCDDDPHSVKQPQASGQADALCKLSAQATSTIFAACDHAGRRARLVSRHDCAATSLPQLGRPECQAYHLPWCFLQSYATPGRTAGWRTNDLRPRCRAAEGADNDVPPSQISRTETSNNHT